jgi:hypothetical protein
VRGRDFSREAKTQRLVVLGGDLSCEAETCRVRRRLIVRGGDISEGIPLVGNWCDNPPKKIPYYHLKPNPLWSLSNSKVSSCR